MESAWIGLPADIVYAAALVHAVPGAVVTVTHHDGVDAVVAFDPAADLSPCVLRAILAEDLTTEAGYAHRVRDVRVGGSLTAHGGSVFSSRAGPRGAWWVVTSLDAGDVESILAGSSMPVDADDVDAEILGDVSLGVTLVSLASENAAAGPRLGAIARHVRSMAAVEELIAPTRSRHGQHLTWSDESG